MTVNILLNGNFDASQIREMIDVQYNAMSYLVLVCVTIPCVCKRQKEEANLGHVN